MERISSSLNEKFCNYCNAKIIAVYEFCPKCGSPISENARKLKRLQNQRIEIELLEELSEKFNDEKSLKVILEELKKR